MQNTNNISVQVLKDRVQTYEKETLNAQIKEIVTDSPLIIKFEGVRRAKLVAILSDKSIEGEINIVNNIALVQVDKDGTLSENIEVFTLSVIADSQRNDFDTLFLRNGLSLTITDRIQMEGIDEFKDLFAKEDCKVDYDSSLYEYLSMSNDVMDVKNSLFYALLLMMIYQNSSLTQDSLEQMMHEKYGRNVGDVPLALKSLRRQKKISTPGRGGTISLTEEEKTRLEQSLKEEKALESDFREHFEAIIKTYGIVNGEFVLEHLRKAYQAQYLWHSQIDDDEEKKEEVGRQNFEILHAFIEAQIGDKTQVFISEIKSLCKRNDYLSRYSLSHSFLHLYRSSSYAEYINNQGSLVVLDTSVVANYICYLSKLDEKYDSEWDNANYQSMKTLARLKEKSKGKIDFFIPHDYLQETAGELKKALQFSWFSQIDLPIPFDTGNTFYNYYLFIKDCKEKNDENVNAYSFRDFVSELGFKETDPDASLFIKRTMSYLKYYLEKTGNQTIEPTKGRCDAFDRVKENYEIFLQYNNRKKTMFAVINDVRQALFLANETTYEENSALNFFLVTWDKSLKNLRNLVNEEMLLMSSFSVMNPSNLANKLAFRNFSLNGKNVSEDVFAYANSNYNIVSKVQSLYDNVLTPFFANANNHNATLVSTILKMEKNCLDEEGKDDGRIKENTTLADVFLPIVYALPENDLSTQNLREFLADEKNNDFVINLLTEAFSEYSKGRSIDISERFCARMKEILSGSDEIKL